MSVSGWMVAVPDSLYPFKTMKTKTNQNRPITPGFKRPERRLEPIAPISPWLVSCPPHQVSCEGGIWLGPQLGRVAGRALSLGRLNLLTDWQLSVLRPRGFEGKAIPGI